jgi:DNA (cytosine-5)-methyltransferase 1
VLVNTTAPRQLKVAGLFAGIGGIELGLERAGHRSAILSEVDPWASAVLARRFPSVENVGDVRGVSRLPSGTDLLAAGFPCQDLSLAGTRAGLAGERSGLVSHVFRLVRKDRPELVLLENVSNLLRLGRGEHLRRILHELDGLGYSWAYRLVDTRGFGVPQRRLRVVILASAGDVEPSDVLFRRSVEPDVDDRIVEPEAGHAYGFYWTEGRRGVGWARDAVPTIKGGSGLGIPSPPAVFQVDAGLAGTISLRDAERLQGLCPGWTDVPLAGTSPRPGARWKMVGNAVTVHVSKWVGRELARPRAAKVSVVRPLLPGRPMPHAAMSTSDGWVVVESSTHVSHSSPTPILEFLKDDLQLLSERALAGYLGRVKTGTKTLPAGFVSALGAQLRAVS